MTAQALKKSEFREFASLVYDKAGIYLKDEKIGLVQARVGKILRVRKIDSYSAYLALLKQDDSGELLVEFLNAISTNVTHFFREQAHFDFLVQKIIPEKEHQVAANKEPYVFRCWSAGCSKGHEPYTLAMTLLEHMDVRRWQIKILASDLSTKVLQEAMDGVYEEDHLKMVPKELVRKYFAKTASGYAISDDVKKLVTFRQFNLTNAFPFKNKFDLILCRNVMIYFDSQFQENLVNRYHQVLRPGGHLFIGHCETLNRLQTPFKFVKASVYKK